MKLIAIKHISDQLPTGTVFEQSQITDANILIAAGVAKPYEEPSAAGVQGSDFKGSAGKPPAVGGQGNILEGVEPATATPPSATSEPSAAPARRGRHRRRDMRAED